MSAERRLNMSVKRERRYVGAMSMLWLSLSNR
jgi:hypothetical protein